MNGFANIVELKFLPPTNQWDQNFLEQLFANKIYDTGYNFEYDEDLSELGGAVIVIPGQYYVGKESEVAEIFAKYKWVLAIKTGDEEDLFDWKKLQAPHIKWWIQTPRTDRDYGDARLFGVGYTPHFNNLSSKDRASTVLDVFLSAQDTHERRHEAFKYLEGSRFAKLIERTPGFTQGMEKDQYRNAMVTAKVAPAPSGVVSPDSFRVYEALEAHTVPIADDISPNYDSEGYWNKLYPDAPFPILKNYSDLNGYIEDVLYNFPVVTNRVVEWWMLKKREMVDWITDDIEELSGFPPKYKDDVTVIIPISPIKSHPDTSILDETIQSVRHHLPNSEIVLMFDGVRQEQEDRRADYEDFINEILWKADHEYKNIVPVIFEQHMHQTGMTRAVLNYIKTPLLLFVEQDTPLVKDETIAWDDCKAILKDGEADVVRFHHEGVIPVEHEHMMHGLTSIDGRQSSFMRTSQWSQRPHLSTVAFYKRIMETCFSEDSKSFIEDKMHGVVANAWLDDGILGWYNFRVVIYHPKTGNIKRSYHTDGRAGEQKWDDTQVF